MTNLILCFPFLYFIYSRLNNLKAWVFHSYFEWFPSFLILYYYSEYSLFNVFINWGASYLAFIAIYEIGYLINDFYSTKNEDQPRRRGGSLSFGRFNFLVFVAIRIGVFVAITWLYHFYNDIKWLTFYSTLISIIILHNTIKEKQLKPMSFSGMALLRFFAPFIFFINDTYLGILMIAVFINYVLFRLLTYMDSKDLLKMPIRKTAKFKMNFYFVLLPINVFISLLFHDLLPITLSVYYLIFTLIAYLAGKMNKSF